MRPDYFLLALLDSTCRDTKPLLSLRMPSTPDFDINDSGLDSASSIPTLDAFPSSHNDRDNMEHHELISGDALSDTDRLKQDFESLASGMMGWMEKGRQVLRDIEKANRES